MESLRKQKLKTEALSSEKILLLTVLLQNREFDIPSGLALDAKEYLLANFSVDYESCNAIIGYPADDSYFSFAQDFINGTISYRQLNNAMYKAAKPETNLKLLRKKAGLSQRKLADLSSVPVRTIQQYEQRQKNINKAQAEYLVMLAKVLCCEVEDLMEKTE